MESGLDWGHGDSRISPTWDISMMNSGGPISVQVDPGMNRNTPWGLGSGESTGTSAWSSGASNQLGRTAAEQLLALGSRASDSAGSDLWRAGSWNRLDERSAPSARSNGIGGAGWGQVPVCQGSAWDAPLPGTMKESVRMVTEPEVIVSSSNVGSSDGTDIWRVNLAKSTVGHTSVGSAPVGIRSMSSVNDSSPWMGRDLQSLLGDGLRPAFQSASLPHAAKPTWDSNGSSTWGNVTTDVMPAPAVATAMQNSSSRIFTMRRSPSSSGAWNTTDLPEADFGHWSQSSAATVPAPAQQKIDNGTAVWGAPPVISEALGTNRSASDAQPPGNILPFSIDFSVPPPPVFKMSNAPGVSPNYWNPNVQPPKTVGNWGSVFGESARPMVSVPGVDWTDSSFNRKGVSVSSSKLHSQPQMRCRLLQQLMDAGFRKEDAQNAIIRNDMNYERAMADLMMNAPRVNPTPDFPTVLGDSSVRQNFQGLDNSFNLMVSVPSNVYPPIVPSLPRDVQAKLLTNLQTVNGHHVPTMVSNESRAHEMQSKQQEQHVLQQKLLSLLMQVIQSGAWSPQLLPLITKQLSPAQIIILQQVVELQTVLTRLQETRSQTPPGEQRDQIEALIAKIQSEIVNRQLSMMDRKPPSNGSSPVDAGFLCQLQMLGLKGNDVKPALNSESCTSSVAGSLSPDFACQSSAPISTWPSMVTSLSSSSDFTDSMTSHAKTMSSASVSPSFAMQSQSANAAASLNIKEFIPGRPWVAESVGASRAIADNWKAPGWGTTDAGSGLRRGSLTLSKRPDGSAAGGSLSSSDWSLDMISTSSGGLKSDLTLSMPTVWSPVDGKTSNSVTAASVYQSAPTKASYASSLSDTGMKSNGADALKDLVICSPSDQVDNSAMKMLCNGWGDGSYEHGWSLGDDAADSGLLPVDLLTDQ